MISMLYRRWMSWLSVVCGCLFLLACVLSEKRDESFEKVVFENHEYLIYRHRQVFHNPDCPCRRLFYHPQKESQ